MQHIKTKAEFEQLIKENNNVIIDFYATWCGPCKMLAPIIEQVANEKENIKRYNQGDALFVCGSRRMQINVVVSEEELESFGSGGGY